MPLPKFNRPAIPYNPVKLPFYNRYSALGRIPPSAIQLDSDFDAITDFMNLLATAIDETAAGIFPGADNPNNANRLPTTDGLGNMSWTLIQSINIGAKAVRTAHIYDEAVTVDQLAPEAVTDPKIAPKAIKGRHINDGAVSNIHIANGTVTLPKLRSSANKCLLMGTAGSNAYTEKVADNNSQPWYVFCNDPNLASISLNSLATIWNYTPYTFTGIKLTDKTVGLTKLVTDAVGGFLISGAGNTGVEILPVLDTDYWKIAVRTSASGGKVTLKGLPEICANYANSIDGGCLRVNTVAGSKVTDGSLPKTKLQNAGQVAPFAMGYIAANGSAQKVFNCTSSRLSLGRYKITLSTVAPDTKYIVVFGNGDNGGNYVTNCFLVDSTRNTGSFEIQVWGSGGAAQDEGFSFVVYAF